MASIPPPPPPPPPLLLLLPQPNLLSLPQARSKPKRRRLLWYQEERGWLARQGFGGGGRRRGLLLLSLEEGSLARIHTEGGRGKKRDKSFWHQFLLLLSFFSVFQMGKERLLRFCPIFFTPQEREKGGRKDYFLYQKNAFTKKYENKSRTIRLMQSDKMSLPPPLHAIFTDCFEHIIPGLSLL